MYHILHHTGQMISYHDEIASLASGAPAAKKAITTGYLTTIDHVRFNNTSIPPAIGIEPPIIVDFLQACNVPHQEIYHGLRLQKREGEVRYEGGFESV